MPPVRVCTSAKLLVIVAYAITAARTVVADLRHSAQRGVRVQKKKQVGSCVYQKCLTVHSI